MKKIYNATKQKEKLAFINEMVRNLLKGEFNGGELELADSYEADFDWAAELFNIDELELASQVLNIYELVK